MFLVIIQKTFLMGIYSCLNILCYFFYALIVLGKNIKGTIFSGRVRPHPSHSLTYAPALPISLFFSINTFLAVSNNESFSFFHKKNCIPFLLQTSQLTLTFIDWLIFQGEQLLLGHLSG